VAVGGRVTLVFDEIAMAELLRGPTGPVGRMLEQKGEIVTQGAKRRAAVSPDGSNGRPPGYMRSQIEWKVGVDAISIYVDISSPALSKNRAPYGLFVEVGTRPHEIRWPYYVNGVRLLRLTRHPGTDAQPYLRPALEDLRGA
jgi:hypothetical protein